MTENELQSYKMSMEERDKLIKIQNTIRRYCKEFLPSKYEKIMERHIAESVYYEHYVGYCNGEGYYYINIGDRGKMHLSCRTDCEEEMLFYLMENILRDVGMRSELKVRNREGKNWMYYEDVKNTKPGKIAWIKNKHYIYHTRHDTRKWWFEYIISNLSPFFNDVMLETTIEEYTGYMNRWFEDEHWKYDREKKQFVEISNSVEKE